MSDRARLRLAIFRVLVLTLLGTLFVRLWFLQVVSGPEYRRIAVSNHVREVVTPAPRGRILDDFGNRLVSNRTALVVSVTRSAIEREKDDGAEVLARLSKITKMPVAELRARIRPCGRGVKPPCWNGSPYQPVPIVENADPNLVFYIQERLEDFPGVTAGLQAIREYPRHTLAAHVLGYLKPVSEEELKSPKYGGYRPTDLVGASGLEDVYDRALRGESGVQRVAVNSAGVVTDVLETREPTAGNDLVLSLDTKVQQVVEAALVHGVARARRMQDRDGRYFKAPSAAGIVMEAQTGRLVALASYPTYDPGVFVGGISTKEYAALNDPKAGLPLISRTTQGTFAPGSTYKLVSTLAAFSAGRATTSGTYSCPSSYRAGNRLFKNFEGEALGPMNMHTALVKSCDTIYYKFGHDEWKHDGQTRRAPNAREALATTARKFGFGAATGVDLSNDLRGRVLDRGAKVRRYQELKDYYCRDAQVNPDPYIRGIQRDNCADGDKWLPGDEVMQYIGQGETSITPLQLAVAYGALANGGTVHAPRLAKAVIGPGQKVIQRINPKVRGRLGFSDEHLRYIRAALSDVTKTGTAQTAFAGFPFGQVEVAGKTGTAEAGFEKRVRPGAPLVARQDTSWFAAFGGRPGQPPKYVVVTMFEQSGQGGRVAAPAVREIFEGIYGLGGRPAALPLGETPTQLPRILSDGSVSRPTSPAVPAPRSSSTPAALGPATPAWSRRR